MGHLWGMSDEFKAKTPHRWAPGESGNPGGRPKSDLTIKAACRAHTAAAIQVLVDALSSDDERIRIVGAQALLDRGYGKAAAIDEEAVIERAIAMHVEQAMAARAALPPRRDEDE